MMDFKFDELFSLVNFFPITVPLFVEFAPFLNDMGIVIGHCQIIML